MPDTIGFALASAFLASVFTIFGLIDRLVAGVAAEIRYSVAPAMVSGVRAWRSEGVPDRPGSPPAENDERGDGSAGEGGLGTPAGLGDGLVVPVGAVERRGWHLFGRLMRTLVGARRPGTGAPSGA